MFYIFIFIIIKKISYFKTYSFFFRLLTITTLAESDDEDADAIAWVQKNRDIIKQKEDAAKRVSIFFNI